MMGRRKKTSGASYCHSQVHMKPIYNPPNQLISCVHTHTYMYVNVCTHIYIYTHIHTYMHLHIQAHTHTLSLLQDPKAL